MANDECGSVGAMSGSENRSTRRKHAALPLRPPGLESPGCLCVQCRRERSHVTCLGMISHRRDVTPCSPNKVQLRFGGTTVFIFMMED
jgi:hypothetical protein